jgi:hypothetical protein
MTRKLLEQALNALEHYERQDVKNARYYPPEFAKDVIPAIRAELAKTPLPVAEWVAAPGGGYPCLKWKEGYVAAIGDKFALIEGED